MDIVKNILLLVIGLFIALVGAAALRVLPGIIGELSISVIILAVAIFILDAKHAFSLSAGMALGFDTFSAYPFGTYVIVFMAITVLGTWLSKTYFTNRSLFAFLLLALSLRIAYSLLLIIIPGSLVFIIPNALAPQISWVNVLQVIKAVGVELIILTIIWQFYVKVRGKPTALRIQSYAHPRS